MLSSRPADIQLQPSKTPGRMKGRGENAIRGPMTVQGKGKEAAGRTPCQPTTLHPQKLFKDGSTAQLPLKPTFAATRPNTRPLVDKTPFPNRSGGQQFQTPLPQGSKLAGLSFLEPGALLQFDKTPSTLLRPSSTRKHARTPRSSGKNFETPANNGNHWDVSDLNITTPEVQAEKTVIEKDYDEIEYMAPNNLDLPYEPPFDFELPDYTEVGKTLFKLAHLPRYDDEPIPELDFPVDQIELLPWDMFDLPELGPDEDDPFYQAKLGVRVAPNIQAQLGTLAKGNRGLSRPVPPSKPIAITRAPSVRSTTTISRATASSIPRPGTATSSTTSTLQPTMLKRANTTANITTAGATSTLKPAAALRTFGSRLGPSTMKPATITTTLRNKPPITSIPPRPATSTSTRVRTTANNNSTLPMRRPTTSAAMYKLSTRKPVVAQDVIVIRGDLDFDDDFRFDV